MYRLTSFLLALLVLITIFSVIRLEEPLFKTPHTTLLRDKDHKLLSAKIAEDYQWRFPLSNNVSSKFIHCITTFEDKKFYNHFGVDFTAVLRALYLNIKNRKVVSGASTITMQVIRLSRRNKSRTVSEKIIEMILALKLELFYSKDEIMALYASYAPFGGNVVGLEAASWRYYNRESSTLSWSEAAALSVLPNSPGLIYPGRNEEPFKIKRDKVLMELRDEGVITNQQYKLALQEPLPSKPKALPNYARHLLNRSVNDGYTGQEVITTVDRTLQIQVNTILDHHIGILSEQGIYNGAAIVIDIETGNTLAYIGNSSSNGAIIHGNDVDIISSKRSPGSILKPILYALAIDDGIVTPQGYLYDTPLYYKGFKPENYSYEFNGIVNADKALQRSLNIPFVNLLNSYDYTRFYDRITAMGLEFSNSADYYGLTMILGGAEVSLWDITSLYAGAARSLNSFNRDRLLSPDLYFKNRYVEEESFIEYGDYTHISPGALYTTFDTMTKLSRPDNLGNWEVFNSSYPISWKTGTSTGFKDAWALGFTSKYLVGVWTGNADGEGRAGLVGVKSAAPILFDIFKTLPKSDLFQTPVANMKLKDICSDSGYIASINCLKKVTKLLPDNRLYESCSFHKIIHLDEEENFQVKSPYPSYKMVHKPWLIFDPVTSWYYKNSNSTYITPPEFLNDTSNPMEFIYPSKSSLIYVPIELDGEKGSTVFEVAHKEDTILYWHLDGNYIGMSDTFHQKLISPDIGKHIITVLDRQGNEISRMFEIIK